MRTRNYCTLFDSNYLPHALSLFKSLTFVSPNSILFAFCMDENCYEHLEKLKLPNLIYINGILLEKEFPSLSEIKLGRTKVEFYYTCSPLICKYIFNNYNTINELTYLDADLYFFANPEPLFEEIADNSIAIIGHRFSLFTRRNKIYGNFNVGWITFRKDFNGLKCLNDWAENCLKWCYQKLEDGKYADQKYLDYWHNMYEGVIELKNIGANLAIWNINNYKLSLKNEIIYVNNQPLIFYHFANLKQIGQKKFQTDLSRVFMSCQGIIKNKIYLPYIYNLIHFNFKEQIIITKKETNTTGFSLKIKKVTRNLRQLIFNDIIDIYDTQ